MKARYAVIFLLSVIIVAIFPSAAYATGITLDGNFDDWSDKPQLQDPAGDETPSRDMVLVKWFPGVEDGKLYLYCERRGPGEDMEEDDDKDENIDEDVKDFGKKIKDYFIKVGKYIHQYWWFFASFDTEFGHRTALIAYRPVNSKVRVILFDEHGIYLWSATGKWGDDRNTAKRVEFYIPLSYLARSAQSGFQIDLYYQSGFDRTPDSGTIKISTISTFPVQTVTGAILLPVAAFFVFARAKRKRTVMRS